MLKNKGKIEICHDLLRCQSVTPQCKIIHNRDKNAVQNMLNIGETKYIFFSQVNDLIYFVEQSVLKIHTWFMQSYTQIFTFLYIFLVVKLAF